MRTTLLAVALLLASGSQASSKYILGAKRLSTTEIAISCSNGGDPTGQIIGQTLIISCGQR
jgi:hypothetical protein